VDAILHSFLANNFSNLRGISVRYFAKLRKIWHDYSGFIANLFQINAITQSVQYGNAVIFVTTWPWKGRQNAVVENVAPDGKAGKRGS